MQLEAVMNCQHTPDLPQKWQLTSLLFANLFMGEHHKRNYWQNSCQSFHLFSIRGAQNMGKCCLKSYCFLGSPEDYLNIQKIRPNSSVRGQHLRVVYRYHHWESFITICTMSQDSPCLFFPLQYNESNRVEGALEYCPKNNCGIISAETKSTTFVKAPQLYT